MKKSIKNKSPESILTDAEKHFKETNYKGAVASLDLIDSMLVQSPDALLYMKSTNLRGLINFKKGDFNIAEQLLLESLELSKLIGDPRYIYNRYDNLAALYINSKRYRQGIDCLQKAIELKESVGNQKDLSRGYIQLASLLFSIENIDAGKEILKKAYILIRKFRQRELLMHWHMAMGMQCKREGKYKLALSEYSKVIRFSVEFNDHTVTAKAYSNQGDILMQQERWAESEKKYLASLQLAKKHSISNIELTVSVQLATIALEKRDLGWCRTIFDFVSRKAIGLDNESLHKDLSELSARLNKAEGNYQDALESYQK